jgi:hypothetical protein
MKIDSLLLSPSTSAQSHEQGFFKTIIGLAFELENMLLKSHMHFCLNSQFHVSKK